MPCARDPSINFWTIGPCSAGFVKARGYNARMGADSLQVVPVSQAQARQRSGRAGGRQAGTACGCSSPVGLAGGGVSHIGGSVCGGLQPSLLRCARPTLHAGRRQAKASQMRHPAAAPL